MLKSASKITHWEISFEQIDNMQRGIMWQDGIENKKEDIGIHKEKVCIAGSDCSDSSSVVTAQGDKTWISSEYL